MRSRRLYQPFKLPFFFFSHLSAGNRERPNAALQYFAAEVEYCNSFSKTSSSSCDDRSQSTVKLWILSTSFQLLASTSSSDSTMARLRLLRRRTAGVTSSSSSASSEVLDVVNYSTSATVSCAFASLRGLFSIFLEAKNEDTSRPSSGGVVLAFFRQFEASDLIRILGKRVGTTFNSILGGAASVSTTSYIVSVPLA
ncbi:hypothetical protein PsorP6_018176 [Peronosclerospora sorghi]|uniref:Uncharacterized protein n=1 Tax=Peronosclerospora sorghi TaxID=230839 RepID=A0ACC0WDE3_9STRA|nr:hypothetical protein PsorP6_018176 [Peronosclerospora sorghi]